MVLSISGLKPDVTVSDYDKVIDEYHLGVQTKTPEKLAQTSVDR